ncbi:MAG TPA: non-canonical purine NTP pyrophosphatase [Patescibacteria group bacterium]|nr:non-canonical purine NTP pyrophosphatase [Patescibacteria group bacterium]
MKKIYLSTTNKGKLKEFSEILDLPLVAVNIDVDEVQSMDLEYVSRKKAEAAFEKVKKPVIVDDVGVYFEAWNGFPGPFIKFLNESVGYDGISRMLDSVSKKMRAVDAISYHDGKKIHTFIGEFNGTIVERRGENGFGFDPIVMPDGYSMTFAEMDPADKHKISHRGRALAKFKNFLDGSQKSK